MTNEFFTRTRPLVSGSKAHMANVQAELDALQAAIDKLQTELAGLGVRNPTFEEGDLGWDKGGCWKIVEDAVNARRGSWVAKISTSGDATLGSKVRFAVQPGEQFLITGWVSSETGADGEALIRVSWRDGDDIEIATSEGTAIAGGTATYRQSRAIVVAPANAVQGRIEFVRRNNTTGMFWVDDASIDLIPKNIDIPSDVTTVTVVAENFRILIKWPDIDDLDRDRFEVRRGASFDTGALVDTTDALSVSDDPQPAGVVNYWIKAIDTSGNFSPNALNGQITISAPDAPIVSTAFDKDEVTLTWDKPAADFSIAEYEIRRGGTDFASAEFVAVIDTRKHNLPAVLASEDTWRVAAIDIAGNVGAAGSVAVDILLPSVSNLNSQVIDNNVLLRWNGTEGSLPIDRYEIRKGAVFASAEVVGTADGTFAVIQEQAAGSFTYWVVARDSAGNVGTETGLTTRVDEPPDFVFRSRFDTDWIGNVRTNIKPLRSGVGDTDELRTALSFDGVDDAVLIGDVLDRTGSFTVECKIKPDDVDTAGQRLIAKDGGVAGGWGFSLGDPGSGALRFFHRDLNTVSTDTPTGVVIKGRYQHVRAVFDAAADTVTIFVDGVQKAQTTGQTNAITANANNLRFGRADSGGTFYKGLMDEVRIWAEAHTTADEDIELIGDEANLDGYWRGNANPRPGVPDTTLEDLSGNDNDGTIQGAIRIEPQPVAFAPIHVGESWLGHHQNNTPINFAPTDVDTAADTITIIGHPYVNGEKHRISTTGTLPGGIPDANADGTSDVLFVVGATADTFQLALTSGGAAIDITDQGTGTHTAKRFFQNTQDKISAGYTKPLQPTPHNGDATFDAYYDVGVVVASSRIVVTPTFSTEGGAPTVSAEIAARKLQSDPWTVSGTDDVFATDFQFIRVTFTVTTTSQLDLLRLSELESVVRSKTKTDSGRIEVTANPTTVTFNVDFLDVQGIVATPEATTAVIAVVDFNDVQNPVDFDVYLFNSTDGTSAAGAGKFVRWEAAGF